MQKRQNLELQKIRRAVKKLMKKDTASEEKIRRQSERYRNRNVKCKTKQNIKYILLGPPGYTQAFPNLRPGLLNCLVWHRNE
jgi:hypothetical protein